MDIARLGIAVDTRQLRQGQSDLRRFREEGVKTGGAVKKSADVASNALRNLAVSVGAAGVIGSVLRAGEAYTKMTNSLRVLGLTSEQAAERVAEIGAIASRTRAPLEATAKLYQRVTIASKDMGASQEDVLQFTENVGLALAQQGGAASEASGALLQLSQALAGGVVRAEEFNSILEGAFPIAQAAANGIAEAGGSVGKLRELMLDGKITSEAFFNAILSQSDALKSAFANTVPTVGQAVGLLGDSFILLAGRMDSALGITETLARGIITLSENLDRLAFYAGAAAFAFTISMAPAILAASLAAGKFVAALVLTRAALIRTGIGAVVVLLGEFAFRASEAAEKVGGFGVVMQAMGAIASDVWEKIAAGASFVGNTIAAISSEMDATFIAALRRMAGAFVEFTWTIADGLNSLFKTNLTGASAGITQDLGKAELAARAAGEASRAAAEAAKTAWEKPLGSLQDYIDGVERVADTSTVTGSVVKDLGDDIEGAGGKAKRAAKDAKELADEMSGPLVTAVDGVSNAFGDFIVGGLRDFKGFVRSILDSFKSMIAQMIATAASNRIMIGLGISGGASIAGGVASAAVGGGGGGGLPLPPVGLLGNALGSFGTGGGLAGLAGGTGLLGGAGNVIGGLASGGLSGGLSAVGGALSGATSGIAGAAAAIGAVAVPLLAVAAVFSFFKKKTKELDAGLRVTVNGFTSAVDTFSKVEESRFFGLRKKKKERFSAASPEVADPVGDAISEIQGSIVSAAASLGVGVNAFESFAYQLKVSTKGLSEEAANKAIQDALDGLSNSFAGMIPGLAGAQRGGETLVQTLSRLSTSLSGSNVILDQLGLRLFDISVVGAVASSNFVDLFGSLESLNSISTAYYQNFYTQEERLKKATQGVTEALLGLGVDRLPQTFSEYRALIENADALGQKALVAELLKLSPAFAEVRSATDATRQALEADAQAARDQKARDRDTMLSNFNFRTLQDQQFARATTLPDSTIAELESDEATRGLLAELIRAIREGDINNALISQKILQVQQRNQIGAEL